MFRTFCYLKSPLCLSVSVFLFYSAQSLAISDVNQTKNPTSITNKVTNTSPWTISDKSDNRSVKYRQYKKGPQIEIKGKVTLKSSLSAALLFLQDGPNMPNWLHNAASSKILTLISANENVSLIRFNAIWPVKDREMIIRSRFWQNSDLSIEVSSEDTMNQYHTYTSANVVGINMLYSHWTITPITKGMITIEYTIAADPNGIIPHWLTKRIALNATWKTLGNILHQLPSSSFQAQKLTQIIEPE